MSSGGQQPVTQQTQQTKDPWAPAQQNLQQSLNISRFLSDNDVGYKPWNGPTQAGLNPIINQGFQELGNEYNNALGGTQGVNAARQLGLEQIQSRGLSPELQSLYQQAQGGQNPYLEATIRQQVNAANSAASAGGRYGSGGHDAAITQAMAPTLAQDYARRQQQMQGIAEGGLQRAGNWATVMPGLDEARLAGAQGLLGIGQFFQERDQRQLEDQIKVWNAQQSRDWEQVARLNAIAGQAGGLGGTQFGTQTTPINQPSTLQKLFGGAAAGAGIGGSFGGAPGGAIGAGLGGLLGMM
jgi:hypothetical protein